jgi:glycosyltransferase involved in cell wall biosynthesis
MNSHMLPRITIVTPSYNQGRFIEETITSVLDQQYDNLQYIVIDGGSTDTSPKIIQKYTRHLAYWCSERDHGQADAIRKGMDRADGDLLNWLNSDDRLAPGGLNHIATMVGRHPEASIYAAATQNFRDGSPGCESVSVPCNIDVESLLNISDRKSMYHQPGIYFRRELYKRVGGVNPRFHYVMDYDLYLRMAGLGAVVEYDSTPVAQFRYHEGQKTLGAVLHTAERASEMVESSNAFARQNGIGVDHSRNVDLLCGGLVMAIQRGQVEQAYACAQLALRLGGPSAVCWALLRGAQRRLARCLAQLT